MHRIFWRAILSLAGLSLLLSGCTGAIRKIPTPTPLTQNLTIELQNTPTEAVVDVAATATVPASYAALDGLVWDDQDRDGVQDFQEMGLSNITVNLLTGSRAPAGTTITDTGGAYRFQDLEPGDYFVSLQLPPGYVFSPQGQGVNELVDSDIDPTTSETVPATVLPGENGLVFTTGLYSPNTTVSPKPGTVKPPPPDIKVCVPGTYSLGGISTVVVNTLGPDYCLRAYLWNHGFALGRIPEGAGRILSAVTFVEFFYQGTFVYQVDATGGMNSVQVCYAVPTGMQAQIYFFDQYGPRFGHPHQGQPSWVPLETTIQDGVACVTASTSGAYALIGK